RPLEQQQGAGLTAVGLTLGTPDYMSPEQAMADPLDGRSDLYSLGVVLYHALTGRLPYDATNPNALVAAILTKSPIPPRQANPQLSFPLEAVLLKALQRDPNQRFQTGGEFRRALETAAGGAASPTYIRPAAPPYAPTISPPASTPAYTPPSSPPAGMPAFPPPGSPPGG